jgi:hypothetical protein
LILVFELVVPLINNTKTIGNEKTRGPALRKQQIRSAKVGELRFWLTEIMHAIDNNEIHPRVLYWNSQASLKGSSIDFCDGEHYILVCTLDHTVINREIGWMPEANRASEQFLE